ncbi:hypothetical protein THAOC_30034, partial [Thalassiosira oceanica]
PLAGPSHPIRGPVVCPPSPPSRIACVEVEGHSALPHRLYPREINFAVIVIAFRRDRPQPDRHPSPTSQTVLSSTAPRQKLELAGVRSKTSRPAERAQKEPTRNR